ncbi:MAG: BPL-N domain-containing protein [Desulfovibrio sp.]|uniref:BPL-N domain-containing protein n=1 Tax=Desulfovibrio sp. 7SRBS1 TaxID=3378064 RepID=UPI003B3D2E4A
MAEIQVLWDDSHIWGLLVLKALQAWNVPMRLVRGADVAGGCLVSGRPGLLVVPGGNARRKAQTLGHEGVQAVRDFVSGGGNYLGFCGGAGLGLSDGGLKLCPWCRKPFESRLQHLVSGHMRVRPNLEHELTPDFFSGGPADGADTLPEAVAEPPADDTMPVSSDQIGSLTLPVWWPSRFAPDGDSGLSVLATYDVPDEDFWVADMRLADLPEPALSLWEEQYGIRLRPDFMCGQPCLVQGEYGKGRYVLSYAHLETPASPQANGWLAFLLAELGGLRDHPEGGAEVPEWNLRLEPKIWEDPTLLSACTCLQGIIAQGTDHFLLFERNSWLMGWRRGLPGLAINSLYALVRYCLSQDPGNAALQYWRENSETFAALMREFCAGVSGYLLAERLDMALSHSPQAVCMTGLKEQRRALFGPPPSSGGIYGQMQALLEELVFFMVSPV